jgi:hypothetical protein
VFYNNFKINEKKKKSYNAQFNEVSLSNMNFCETSKSFCRHHNTIIKWYEYDTFFNKKENKKNINENLCTIQEHGKNDVQHWFQKSYNNGKR